MITRYRDAWTHTLTDALARRRRAWMKGPLKPHMVVLPTSRERLGAWMLFGTIYISKGQLSCPPHVRNYIVGHELGHIVNGDVFIQLLFTGSYVTMILTAGTGSAVQLFGILISTLSLLMYALPTLALERELRADRVAVQLYGAEEVLDGSLWMARRLNDMENPERIARLKRLRQYVRNKDFDADSNP